MRIWEFDRNEEILDEKSENLTFNEVGITTQQNISCAAVNEIGSGDLDTVQLEVFGNWELTFYSCRNWPCLSVPPTFIKQLPQETSFLSSSDDFALSCQVHSWIVYLPTISIFLMTLDFYCKGIIGIWSLVLKKNVNKRQ